MSASYASGPPFLTSVSDRNRRLPAAEATPLGGTSWPIEEQFKGLLLAKMKDHIKGFTGSFAPAFNAARGSPPPRGDYRAAETTPPFLPSIPRTHVGLVH